MCLVLYLSSDKTRPTIDWDDTAPSFHVRSDDDDAKKAAKHFTKKWSFYVGSDNGCGCGFRQEHDYLSDDPEQLASKIDNQQRLHNYIADCLQDEESIELYSCWSGDEELPVKFKQVVALSDLLSETFFFAERQKTVILKRT